MRTGRGRDSPEGTLGGPKKTSRPRRLTGFFEGTDCADTTCEVNFTKLMHLSKI